MSRNAGSVRKNMKIGLSIVNKARSVVKIIFKTESRDLHSKACWECKLPSMAITTMHPRLLGSEKSSAIVSVLNN